MLRRRLMKKGIPEGALSGVFSVSATRKVYFSKGNLQLVGSNTWQFADNQWDYFGYTQSDNHRDLFGWGTGNNPNQTIDNNNYYKTFTDWGLNMGTGWFTLSSDEWTYLFNTRIVNNGQGNGKSYTRDQKVNDVLGVVLYPDDYTGELYTTAQSDNWSAFESAGCVFLPAAGSRSGTWFGGIGSRGAYWSSSTYSSSSSYAYFEEFGQGYINLNSDNNRFMGGSVRLVYDVK